MRRHTPKDYLNYFAPAIVLTLAGFAIAYQFVDPAPPRHITIATGQPTGAYYEMGQKYSQILARDGITLEVKATTGSVENLKLILDSNSDVDVIFMQGGIGRANLYEDLVSLGSIYYEPLWVFHRSNLTIKQLSVLKGKRISIGLEGSGSKVLAEQMLLLNNVNKDNSQFYYLSNEEATEKLLAGEIDAAFFVIAYQEGVVRELCKSPGVQLMSFHRASAYTSHFHFLSKRTIPEGAIDFVENIPHANITLLSPTAQIIVRNDFHPALIDLFLSAVKEVGTQADLFTKPGEFPSPSYVDFPLSSDAERFYTAGPPFLQRYLPFWMANFLIRMKIMLLPLLALFFPLFKLLPPFYRWKVRSRIFRWYDQLMAIDYQILHGYASERKNEYLSRLDTIEKKVSKISVPRGYSRELYDMRIHIEMLREKLIGTGEDLCRTIPDEAKRNDQNSIIIPPKMRKNG